MHDIKLLLRTNIMKTIINPDFHVIGPALYVKCVPSVIIQTFTQLHELNKNTNYYGLSWQKTVLNLSYCDFTFSKEIAKPFIIFADFSQLCGRLAVFEVNFGM